MLSFEGPTKGLVTPPSAPYRRSLCGAATPAPRTRLRTPARPRGKKRWCTSLAHSVPPDDEAGRRPPLELHSSRHMNVRSNVRSNPASSAPPPPSTYVLMSHHRAHAPYVSLPGRMLQMMYCSRSVQAIERGEIGADCLQDRVVGAATAAMPWHGFDGAAAVR